MPRPNTQKNNSKKVKLNDSTDNPTEIKANQRNLLSFNFTVSTTVKKPLETFNEQTKSNTNSQEGKPNLKRKGLVDLTNECLDDPIEEQSQELFGQNVQNMLATQHIDGLLGEHRQTKSMLSLRENEVKTEAENEVSMSRAYNLRSQRSISNLTKGEIASESSNTKNKAETASDLTDDEEEQKTGKEKQSSNFLLKLFIYLSL